MNKRSDPALIEAHQENLLFLGFDLGRWGADGKLGTVTKNASHDAATKFSLPPPVGDEIPDALVIGLTEIVAKKKAGGVPKPANFFDLTETAYDTPRVKRVPLTNWSAVTIHQTGCPMGSQSWDQERRHKRWSRLDSVDKNGKPVKSSLKAHIGITHKAEILLIHPLEWFIWHAQQQSHTHIGIEIEAFARGIERDPKTLPSGGFPWVEATDAQLRAGIETVRWIDAVLRFYGGQGLRHINGHRNADNWRRADPGERIYKGVVLPCIQLFGLSDQGPRYKTGDGRYTPEAWNPAYVGNPY